MTQATQEFKVEGEAPAEPLSQDHGSLDPATFVACAFAEIFKQITAKAQAAHEPFRPNRMISHDGSAGASPSTKLRRHP